MPSTPSPCDKSAKLRVRISPGANTDKVLGTYGDELKISLSAPPVDGKANSALIKFLARILGLKSSQITLAHGQTSRSKLINIQGLTEAELLQILAPFLTDSKEKS
ncbi:MAG: DUF167 domain-containing protein [Deltaproteobacteria bacterium]|jgi:uncharacterized protein (TIGR00251 family)|nr:DUF167 domain-containing protein [Deltaproteobacteria bacterium]